MASSHLKDRIARARAFVRSMFTAAEKPAVKYEPALLGDDKGRVRVMAFSCGGADAVFEFGTIHAMMVMDSAKPHIVTGISAGAVVATALAEVLQAGVNETGTARRLAQVARFRAFLNQIQRLPDDLQEALVPDITEVSARSGLLPLESPAHRPKEKIDRSDMALARVGLIKLLNGLLASRVKVSEFTRLIRLVLELKSLEELRINWLRRKGATRLAAMIEAPWRLALKTACGLRIWLYIFLPTLRDAPLLVRCGLAPITTRATKTKVMKGLANLIGFGRLRSANAILFEPLLLRITRRLVAIASYPVVLVLWLMAPGIAFAKLSAGKVSALLDSGPVRTLVVLFTGLIVAAGSAAVLWFTHLETARFVWHLKSFLTLRPTSLFDYWKMTPLVSQAYPFLTAPALGAFFASLGTIIKPNRKPGDLIGWLLSGFNLEKDILTTAVLRRLLMRAFDPNFWGNRDFSVAVDEALGGAPSDEDGTISGGNTSAKKMADCVWTKSDPNSLMCVRREDAILVAPVAADIATGKLAAIDPNVSVVQSLTAACALSPWFAPEDVEMQAADDDKPKTYSFIDGSNVASEPIGPVLELLKYLHLNQSPSAAENEPRFHSIALPVELTYVELCVISPHPTRRLLDAEREHMRRDLGLSRAVPRAVPRTEKPAGSLHRLGDVFAFQSAHAAKDERHLVVLRNIALQSVPCISNSAVFHTKTSATAQKKTSGKPTADDIANCHIYARLREIEPNEELQTTPKLLRCKDSGTRKVVLRQTLAAGCRASLVGLYADRLRKLATNPTNDITVPPCRALHTNLDATELPCSPASLTPSPGIAEICQECVFFRKPADGWSLVKSKLESYETTQRGETVAKLSDWGEAPQQKEPKPASPVVLEKDTWPLDRQTTKGEQIAGHLRPTVSLILSGGVFRGVFQVGVLNALCQAGVKPDVVAGASVGTIMSALSARVLTSSDPSMRDKRIASVAASFLAIDRLVLTDRFADFVRRFTLRAGNADFSLRDADHLFRRFDRRGWETMSRRSRQVLAGIYRMAYLDPIELLDLLSCTSGRKKGRLLDRLVGYGQDALNRAGIGTELLGAEPLEQIIKAHVLLDPNDRAAEFNAFLKDGIHFLATTTNLTTGEIDVLGSYAPQKRQPALLPGLLASSAFPAVFRPRMNWELRAGVPGSPEELVDGGIADNLPILPVSRFLYLAHRQKRIALRPEAGPHLLFTASLEPRKRTLHPEELAQTKGKWFKTISRASELRYNVKIDSHRQTQDDLRRITNEIQAKYPGTSTDLLDLHVSCVKPEWLCGTFGFHPMLGFRRTRQARSIAHGCATTLAHLHFERKRNPKWVGNWWNELSFKETTATLHAGPEIDFTLSPGKAEKPGDCWFRCGRTCPFSIQQLQANGLTEKATLGALSEIYYECGKANTHRKSSDETL